MNKPFTLRISAASSSLPAVTTVSSGGVVICRCRLTTPQAVLRLCGEFNAGLVVKVYSVKYGISEARYLFPDCRRYPEDLVFAFRQYKSESVQTFFLKDENYGFNVAEGLLRFSLCGGIPPPQNEP